MRKKIPKHGQEFRLRHTHRRFPSAKSSYVKGLLTTSLFFQRCLASFVINAPRPPVIHAGDASLLWAFDRVNVNVSGLAHACLQSQCFELCDVGNGV
jgi:hypothetical protein